VLALANFQQRGAGRQPALAQFFPWDISLNWLPPAQTSVPTPSRSLNLDIVFYPQTGTSLVQTRDANKQQQTVADDELIHSYAYSRFIP
jgi:hypothetical protein